MLLITALCAACETQQRARPARPTASRGTQLTWLKYRATPIDLSDPRFEYLDTSRSSFVEGAWYDVSNEYLVLRLKTTYYQYCRVPASEWRSFSSADSFGKYYTARIKGRYDCRQGGEPTY